MKYDSKSNEIIKDEKYYFELAHDYEGSGKYQEAIDAYKQSIMIKPDYAEAHYNLGLVHEKSGRYQKAIDTLNRAIRIKPEYADAYLHLGYALGKVAKYLEAKDAYMQALRIKPDYAEAHLHLALTNLMLGDDGSALDEYRILKDLDNKSAETALTHIKKKQSNDNAKAAEPDINLTSEEETKNVLIKYENVFQGSEKLNNEIKSLKKNEHIVNREKNPGDVTLSNTGPSPAQRTIPDNEKLTKSLPNKVNEQHPAGPVSQDNDDNPQIYSIQTGRFLTIDLAREHIVYITYLLQEKNYDNLRIGKLGNFYIVRLGNFENNQTARKFLQELKRSLSEAVILKTDIKNERLVRLYE